MAHAHRIARYMQLLRKNLALPFPGLDEKRITVESVRQWKQRCRAYDAARLRLGLVTRAQLQRQNSALRIRPGSSKLVKISRYA